MKINTDEETELFYPKLKMSHGVSLIISLFGFLVAAMVSIVIVTAALSSARSVANDQKMTQGRLTVESAAKLVDNQMELIQYTRTERSNIKEGSDYGTGYPKYELNTESGSLGTIALNAVKALDGVSGSNIGDTTGSFTVSVDGLENVTVKYEMESTSGNVLKAYDVKFTLTGSTSGTVLYLLMRRNLVSTTTYDEGEWIDKGSNGIEQTFDRYYTEKTYTYSWSLISIQSEDTTGT